MTLLPSPRLSSAVRYTNNTFGMIRINHFTGGRVARHALQQKRQGFQGTALRSFASHQQQGDSSTEG